MADKAQFLVVPAYTAVVLTLLHDFGLDRCALSLGGWCRDGNGEEGGKDESELHVDNGSFLIWILWYGSWKRAKFFVEKTVKGIGKRASYTCLTSHDL